jgi:hypothetical protein
MADIRLQLGAIKADLRPEIDGLYRAQAQLNEGPAPVETGLALFIEESRIYYVLQEVERLDRELRRTARALREGKTLPLADAIAESLLEVPRDSKRQGKKPRDSTSSLPVDAPNKSSLRLSDAGEGSTDLFLLPLGTLISVFASQPLTAIANALAWSGPIGRVRTWSHRRDHALEGVSARQAFEVLREAGRDPANLLGPPNAEIAFPDGITIRGSRVVLIRTHPDGTTDFVEGTG